MRETQAITADRIVEQPLLENEQPLAGQLMTVRQEPTVIILPPSANRSAVAAHNHTYIDAIRAIAAIALMAVIGALAWEVVTVIIPAVCAGIAAGLKEAFTIAGKFVGMALAGLFGLMLLLILISVVKGIDWSEDESPSKPAHTTKTVINNIHINNNL